MALERGTVIEYIAALTASPIFAAQVVAHRQLPAEEAVLLPCDGLDSALQQLLAKTSMHGLYRHQHEAIDLIRARQHVVVSTPTASGKSLIYNLPVIEEYLRAPEATALYLFPLKALAQDQLAKVLALWQHLPDASGGASPTPAAVYDGDTSAYRRKQIRDRLPAILITNPDMLHLSLLPFHDRWGHFFSRLRHVVIDEVHTYRGIFGSHVAWVLRRLQRICSLYGASPTFILASATVGNPQEHGAMLIDAPVMEISRSGAGRASRHVILLNPLDSAAGAATQLLDAALDRGLRTIVYCQSRKMTELITIWTEQRRKQRSGMIASYRAGFLPEERRGIEQRLADGRLLGVITTSALELGIDIGNLDICILVGYPGSIMATWQRAGRVGRGNQESLVVLIGHEDALDQHFMRNPDDFFARTAEPVTINPDNPHIASQQIVCAAAEIPLSAADPFLQKAPVRQLLHQLTMEAKLLQSADGKTWFSPRSRPQRGVNLRGGGPGYPIYVAPDGRKLGETDGYRALRECHPGAIYLHMAQTFHVDLLDLENSEIRVSPAAPAYFTRVQSQKTTLILDTLQEVSCGSTAVHFGRLRVTEVFHEYLKIAQRSMRLLGRIPLDLPPQIVETEGFWIDIPEWLRRETEKARLHFMGGIHALEHALIGLMPLAVLCDRNDLGGISHPWHEQVQAAAVFVYDGHAGGIGLTARGFGIIRQLLDQTLAMISTCTCDIGCPSCVHSPKCGSGNRPIDKEACLFILRHLLNDSTRRPKPQKTLRPAPAWQGSAKTAPSLPERFGVFDLETQRSAEEVGGWHRATAMRVSVAVLYDNERQSYERFDEGEVDQLIDRLFTLDLVVGFNNKRFDNRVLSAYTDRNLSALPSLDLLEAISSRLGYRLSLERLAERTLGVQKNGDGLQALHWFRQGEFDKLADYCQRDVEITKNLFLFGLRQRYLLFRNKAGQDVRLPVDLAELIEQIRRNKLADAQGQTRSL